MNWWGRIRHRDRMEEQLDRELQFHLEQHAADLAARGHSPDEARRLALLEMGGTEQVKESCRDARGSRWLEDLARDFRYALRTLRQRPGFAAIALLTLALGTGATTVMFTTVNAVLLKPLPYAGADRLVALQEQTDKATQWGNRWAFSYPNYLDCRRGSRSLDLAAWRYNGGIVAKPGAPEYVDGVQVSSRLFPVLGAAIAPGRGFVADDDRPGAAPVAIISETLAERRFGGTAAAIGAPIVFDGKSYTVAGIAPKDFRLEDIAADLFTPLGQVTEPFMQNRESHFGFRVWGRLRPDATVAQAAAELAVIGRQLAAQYPRSNAGRTFVADPLRADVADVRGMLWLLLGAVTLVLLIACVNIASLLLARAVSRDRELAMRVALGASRGRLARQCLTESAVLGVTGGLMGLALAAMGIRPFVALWPGGLPRAGEVALDWRVLLFALGVSLGSGLLFGLAPALRSPQLYSGSRGVVGSSRRLHGGFVAAEIALALVLLLAAAMFGRTLLHLSSLDPGVTIDHVLTARAALSPATLASPARIRSAWREVQENARRLPGVRAVTILDTVPLREGYNDIGYRTSLADQPPDQQPHASATCVTPEYLKVMGTRLREGRFFDDQDRQGSEGVVVIDEVMAQQAFTGKQPLGQHLWIGMGSDPVRVVGVVKHVRYWGAADDNSGKVRAQLYYPFAQLADTYLRRWSELMSIAVRTTVPPQQVIEPLRRAVRGSTGDQVLYEERTMEQLASDTLARQRFLLVLFGIFAGLALLLACIGIYGVQAYLTSRRVPEIGVRMALGASGAAVQWMVLREGLRMILAGLGVGMAAALAAGTALVRVIDGMRPAGPLTFAVTAAVLLMAALFASFLPARRASRVEPMKALRQE